MLKKISIILGITVILTALIAGGYFVYKNSTLAVVEASGCVQNPEADLTGSIAADGKSATVTNKSSTCTYKVGMASYKKYSNNIETQVLLDSTLKDIGPKTTIYLSVNVPSCSAQIDLFYGPLLNDFHNGKLYATRLLNAKHINGDNFCKNTPPPPPAPTPKGCIEVFKEVYESNGSTRIENFTQRFSFKLSNGQKLTIDSRNQVTFTNLPFGSYTVSEVLVDNDGYTLMSPSNNATVVNVQRAHNGPSTCYHIVFKNKKTPPPAPQTGTLKIVKTVINDNGGTKNVSDFALFIENTQVTSGQILTLSPKEYSVRENNLGGYTAGSWGGDCSAYGKVTVEAGKHKTCTITNNDNPVVVTPQNGTLKIIKTVINDNGGTKNVSDFALFIENTQVTSGQILTLPANTYSVRENNLSGYTASSWGGDCSANGTVVVENGKHKTCTITNNDNPPVITHSPLEGYCVANPSLVEIDEQVTWTAYPQGGKGNYTYTWSGWDDLSGNSRVIHKSYTYEGKKPSQVVISDGTSTITVKCTTTVEKEEEEHNDLKVVCEANPTSAYVNEDIEWSASARGGNGSYRYTWTGTDNLSSSKKSFEKSYSNSGVKSGTVKVYSDGETITKTCKVTIKEEPTPVVLTTETYTPPANGGVYLNQVPYTGVSGNMKVSMFILGLIAWSTLIGYVLVKRKAHKLGLSVGQFISEGGMGNTMAFAGPMQMHVPSIVVEPLVKAPEVIAVDATDFMGSLEARARDSRMIISADALSMIAAVTGRDTTDAHAMVDTLVAKLRSTVTDQNDWVIANAQKVSSII
ncbi:MAG: hypothetical protein M3Q63_01915 [bacterium]|nr:hypothetical protein [bacterium]